jgi:hypothetical protein
VRDCLLTLLLEFGEQIPPQVTLPAEELQASSSVAGPSRPLKRTYAMLGMFREFSGLPLQGTK